MPYQISGGFLPIIDNQWPLSVRLWIRKESSKFSGRSSSNVCYIFSDFNHLKAPASCRLTAALRHSETTGTSLQHQMKRTVIRRL